VSRRAKASRPRRIVAEPEVTLDTRLPQNAAAHARDGVIEGAVQINKADRTRVASARRLDAFDALKDTLAPGAYDAVRELERLMTVRRGEGDRGRPMDRVDNAGGRCRLDMMLAAGDQVQAMLARIGERDRWLLSELIEPGPQNQQKPWREVVLYVTGEALPHAQSAAVRSACANLVQGSARRRADVSASGHIGPRVGPRGPLVTHSGRSKGPLFGRRR
jgi:hypothetical protein